MPRAAHVAAAVGTMVVIQVGIEFLYLVYDFLFIINLYCFYNSNWQHVKHVDNLHVMELTDRTR